MGKSIEAHIECPFYIREKELTIKCESLIESAVTIHEFKNKKAKKNYELDFCSVNGGSFCPYHEALANKYK